MYQAPSYCPPHQDHFVMGDRKKSQENFTQKKSQTKVTEKNVTDQNTFDVKNNANYTCLHINIENKLSLILFFY